MIKKVSKRFVFVVALVIGGARVQTASAASDETTALLQRLKELSASILSRVGTDEVLNSDEPEVSPVKDDIRLRYTGIPQGLRAVETEGRRFAIHVFSRDRAQAILDEQLVGLSATSLKFTDVKNRTYLEWVDLQGLVILSPASAAFELARESGGFLATFELLPGTPVLDVGIKTEGTLLIPASEEIAKLPVRSVEIIDLANLDPTHPGTCEKRVVITPRRLKAGETTGLD